MKKLSLNFDTLKVETFATADAQPEEGTVVAHEAPSYPDPVWTCAYHCTWIGTTCQ
jgi:hypothetical protein